MARSNALKKRKKNGPRPEKSGGSLVDLALAKLQEGRTDVAASMLKRAVRKEPNNPAAQFLHGLALLTLGRPELAIAPLEQAVGLDPGNAEGYYHLGRALRDCGKTEPAADAFSRSLNLRPDFAPAYSDLGLLMADAGTADQAAECFRLALQFDPQDAESAFRLGIVEQDRKNFGLALECYSKAVSIDPTHTGAHINLGSIASRFEKFELAAKSFRRAIEVEPGNALAYAHLGKAQSDMEDLEGAIASLRKAIEINPKLADAHNNLGNAFKGQGLLKESVESFKRALHINPSLGVVHYNLADTYHRLRDYGRALASFRRALDLQPGLAEAWNNLGLVLGDMGDFEEALKCFRKASDLAPENHGYKCSISRALYMLGRLEESFELVNHCFIAGLRKPYRRFNIPIWRGDSLEGKRLLVWREQGLGDEIIYSRWYKDAVEAAETLVIEADPRMVSLFQRTYPEAIVKPMDASKDMEREDADSHIYAGGLELFFDRSQEDKNKRVAQSEVTPIFAVDETRSAKWRRRLEALGAGLKVGICWRSQLSTRLRDPQYSDILEWGPLLSVPGVQFVNLQYDDCEEELARAREAFGVKVHVWDDLDLKDDLEEIFALVGQLDLVISAKTSVETIASALATPCWTFYLGATKPNNIPVTHPAMRQTRWGCHVSEDWPTIFERMAAALVHRMREDGGAFLDSDEGERARRLAFGVGRTRHIKGSNSIASVPLRDLYTGMDDPCGDSLLRDVLSAVEQANISPAQRHIFVSIGAIVRHLAPMRLVATGPAHAALARVLEAQAPEGASVLTRDFDISLVQEKDPATAKGAPRPDPSLAWADVGHEQRSRLWEVVRDHLGTTTQGEADPGDWEGSVDLLVVSLVGRFYEDLEAEIEIALRLLGPHGVVMFLPFQMKEGAGNLQPVGLLLDLNSRQQKLCLRHIEGTALVVGSRSFGDHPDARVRSFEEGPGEFSTP